jgi:hypothetical protein
MLQTTLWGNLILGPTAADVADPATALRTPRAIMHAILSKCREVWPWWAPRAACVVVFVQVA